tara:strand:+ start:79 stop:549 length:471 start_codon:yes stop_codon:yes gene_type:complete
MRKAFGKEILELAKKDSKIILISGDVEHEMEEFKNQFPERYINIGLCEQTMITMAAAMCLEGLRPIVYSITPFLIERPFEQIKIDIDENNLPVILIGYADYPTHGPTHRPLNAEHLVKIFKNIRGFFPQSRDETSKIIKNVYSEKVPAIICMRREK